MENEMKSMSRWAGWAFLIFLIVTLIGVVIVIGPTGKNIHKTTEQTSQL